MQYVCKNAINMERSKIKENNRRMNDIQKKVKKKLKQSEKINIRC